MSLRYVSRGPFVVTGCGSSVAVMSVSGLISVMSTPSSLAANMWPVTGGTITAAFTTVVLFALLLGSVSVTRVVTSRTTGTSVFVLITS